jgi:hypothetical protein
MLALLTACVIFGLVGVAIKWGGEPERYGGLVVIGIVGLSLLRHFWFGAEVDRLDWPALTIDVAGFAAFTWIALFAWRLWPLWASSLQLLALAAHLARALNIPIHPLIYAIMRTSPTYLEIVVLLMGVASYRRRTRKFGSKPPWRVWSGRSNRVSPSRWQPESSPTLDH